MTWAFSRTSSTSTPTRTVSISVAIFAYLDAHVVRFSSYFVRCVFAESFKNFANLRSLSLAFNNIRTIRLNHGEFATLDELDLSFNNLSPNDVAHLGILRNLKCLRLTGNNLDFLPDTFSKLYVHSKE